MVQITDLKYLLSQMIEIILSFQVWSFITLILGILDLTWIEQYADFIQDFNKN